MESFRRVEGVAEFLDSARREGDLPADLVLSKLNSRGIGDTFHMLQNWGANSDPLPSDTPVDVREFFEQSSHLPQWVDSEKILEAQRFFSRYPADLLATLMYASLPECYAASDGTELLIHTNKLVDSTDDRLLATARFVVDVLSKGSLEPQGRGIRSTQKIRWIHAVVRQQVADSGAWDPERGVPLNQEHLLGTLIAFSQVSSDALVTMGVRVTHSEQSAYLHLWAVIGYLLGIREEYLPHSVGEAQNLADILRKRNQRSSVAGKKLMADLLQFSQKRFPGFAKGLPTALVRELIPKSTADSLGIPECDRSRRWISALRIAFLVRNNVTRILPVARVFDFYNRVLVINTILRVENYILKRSRLRYR